MFDLEFLDRARWPIARERGRGDEATGANLFFADGDEVRAVAADEIDAGDWLLGEFHRLR